jgi:hypothetical protein
MIDPKSLIRNLGIILLFVVIVGYTLWRGRTAIFGISIESNTADGQAFSNSLITLSGNAKNASRFTIDGREILLDKDGNFTEPLLLPPGYSIIELHAEDHFGRSKNRLLRVYEKSEGSTAPLPETPQEETQPISTNS